MPGRVLRHIFADQIEVVAASTDKGFELAPDHGKNFKKFIRRFYARINNDFAGERYPPRLGKKGKGKAGRQAETFLLVTSAALEGEISVRGHFSARRYVREVGGSFEDWR